MEKLEKLKIDITGLEKFYCNIHKRTKLEYLKKIETTSTMHLRIISLANRIHMATDDKLLNIVNKLKLKLKLKGLI